MAGRPTKYTHDHDDTIEQRYRDGASLSELSREYAIPAMTIKRRLIKRGVEIRNLSTAMKLMNERKRGKASASGENPRNVAFGVQFDDSGNDQGPTTDDEWMS